MRLIPDMIRALPAATPSQTGHFNCGFVVAEPDLSRLGAPAAALGVTTCDHVSEPARSGNDKLTKNVAREKSTGQQGTACMCRGWRDPGLPFNY
ncbi:hypothetical protein MTO96_006860 [Rhipicephalus appendiculatus]